VYRIVLFGETRRSLEPLIAELAQDGHAVVRVDAEADVAEVLAHGHAGGSSVRGQPPRKAAVRPRAIRPRAHGRGASPAPVRKPLREVLARHRPHLALVDAVSLGKRLGLVCEALRRLTSSAPVPIVAIVTPAWLDGQDLPAGVTDFVCEPVHGEEMRVRLRRALWPGAADPDGDVLRVGPLAIDHARHQVFLDGRPLDLTLREYDLLTFLAVHPGRVYSREALLDRVWGLDYLGGTRTVDVHVRRLRVKLDDEVGRLLETVRGVGYRLSAEAEALP